MIYFQSMAILGKPGTSMFRTRQRLLGQLASFPLKKERGTSGYQLSMSNCFILSSSEPNLVLEQIISAL